MQEVPPRTQEVLPRAKEVRLSTAERLGLCPCRRSKEAKAFRDRSKEANAFRDRSKEAKALGDRSKEAKALGDRRSKEKENHALEERDRRASALVDAKYLLQFLEEEALDSEALRCETREREARVHWFVEEGELQQDRSKLAKSLFRLSERCDRWFGLSSTFCLFRSTSAVPRVLLFLGEA